MQTRQSAGNEPAGPRRGRVEYFKDGQEFLPAVQAMAAPGHTVGHHIFMVTSAGKSFAFLGDLSHRAVLLLEKPRMEFSFDTDPKQAAATRVKMLDMLAAKDRRDVVSFCVAGLWPRRQGRRGIPLLPRADADGALKPTATIYNSSCPGLSRASTPSKASQIKDVDGRVKARP